MKKIKNAREGDRLCVCFRSLCALVWKREKGWEIQNVRTVKNIFLCQVDPIWRSDWDSHLSHPVASCCQCSFDFPFPCLFCVIHCVLFVTAGALAHVWLASFQKLCFYFFFYVNTYALFNGLKRAARVKVIFGSLLSKIFLGLIKPIAIRCTQDKSAADQGW